MHKILIVDDSADIRLLLSRTMKAAGYEVFQATDGSEVMPAVLSYEPDLVLMDLKMPGLDGVRATWAVCQEDRRARVLVLSSYDPPESRERVGGPGSAASGPP